MTMKLSPGDSVVEVDADIDVVSVGVVDAATAEPATNTASIAPSANVAIVAAPIIGFLTTPLPWNRALRGAGRAGPPSRRGPRSPRAPRSSAAGRPRAAA